MPLETPQIALSTALSNAWKRKQPLLADSEALRLLNAEASGTPRLVLELYGKHAVFYDYGAGVNELLQKAAPEWLIQFGWESIARIDRGVAGDEGRSGNTLLAGTVPDQIIVREGNLRYVLEPRHARNVGLFLDTRELRTDLAARARGARVLNLFAYTGSLGLAALAGGAAEVVQVDISARYLDWARANLHRNNLPEEACRFKCMDSERYLDWAIKKGLTFDHIILDPPVFSRFEGKVFRWATDYFRLADKCLALLSPGGTLHAVTNYSGITAPEFSARLSDCVRVSGPSGKTLAARPQSLPLPPDFDIAPDTTVLPEGNALIFQVQKP
jgi:23S rRNA (cytosine1962-C5)-methyltransferase